ARSDIFSFGSLLYEMFTGKQPFQGDSKMSTLAAIINKEPLPVHQAGEGVPSELERIVNWCLRKRLDRRAQHMDEIKIALEELKEETASGSLAGAPVEASPPSRRRLALWLAAALAIATRQVAHCCSRPARTAGRPARTAGWLVWQWPTVEPNRD
ncbi:MAG: protein kinase, partial [bacterium]|nr:protein kinase [bacterium]